MGNIYSRLRPVFRGEEQPWIGSSVDPPTNLPEIPHLTDIAIPHRQFGNQHSRTINVVNSKNVTISQGQTRAGTLAKETLDLRIADAKKTFVPTASFKQVQRKLDHFGHVTICGASGEGKTTMSLMLARDYMKKGYEAVFVENVDGFDFNECFSTSRKLFLIVDDMFGTVGLTADVLQLRNLLNSIRTQTADNKQGSVKSYSAHVSGQDSQSQALEDCEQNIEQEKDIRLVITSKTYNFKEGLSKLHYEKMAMFTGQTVVDLTASCDYFYTEDEKHAMFERYKTLHKAESAVNMSSEHLYNIDPSLFGFPLTCRLFFEFTAFRDSGIAFFCQPLFFLRIELNNLLGQNSNQTAALVLMLLCEDKLHLCNLECQGRDEELDKMFQCVRDIVPSATRHGIATAVRHMRGAFLSGGDACRFAHSSIYDACACAMFEINPSFVLSNCSLDFLHARLKPGSVEETKVTDRLNFLFVSESYFDLIATRLVCAMEQGRFSKSVTQPMLKNERFAQILLRKLQNDLVDTNWIRKKDKGKGFLYWAVQMPSSLLVDFENILCIRYSQTDINEGLEGSVEADNITNLKMFFPRLEKTHHSATASRLLLLNAETASIEITEYLLKSGADITTTDSKKRNFVHLLCLSGKSSILKSLGSLTGSVFKKEDYLLALNSVDFQGRTPTMIAAVCGSWKCFQVIKESSLDTQDNYNNNILHLACQGGNTDIVQHVLKSSNVNSRRKFGWTPLMVAAVAGHLDVFDLLVSHNADLSLLDISANSLLHLACEGGNPDIVKRLLTPLNINSPGMHGTTPVMYAAVFGQSRVFDLLLSNNADVTLMDDFGNSVLHLACRGGNRNIVKRLLTSSDINCRRKDGRTPVMVSVAYGHVNIFELLAFNNADFTLVDNNGDSLLHLACQGGYRNIVKHVLTPSNINTRGQCGLTPVMVAAEFGHQLVFDFLTSKKADLTLIDYYGYNLLHLACFGGNMAILSHILTPSNITTRAILHGWTPVMYAALWGNLNMFNVLLEGGADLTLVDNYNDSVLHLACRGGNTDIVNQIVTPDNINCRGRYKWTPVMMAAYLGHNHIIDQLVDKGADLSLIDERGRNVVSISSRGGYPDVARYLEILIKNVDQKH